MEWKFDAKGKRVQKDSTGKGKEDEEEPVKPGQKKDQKKKKSPEPADKPRIEWSSTEDAIEGFKQVIFAFFMGCLFCQIYLFVL